MSADARERLQALGYVGAQTDVSIKPGEELPDPKDKREILERYRAAVDFASQRKWPQAIALLQQILRDDPEMADVWSQLAVFATRLDRFDLAVDAYKHYIALKPQEPTAYIGAAAALLKLRKLDEAREHASLSAEVAAEGDHRSKASAHEMLAKIALAKHDTDTARAEAELAHAADPTLPLPIYIDARLLYDQGKYADALPGFLQAIAELKKSGTLQINELHFYTADTLARLERYPEAETEFIEELKYFPQNIRARGGLAMLYQAGGQAGRGDPRAGRHAARHADAGQLRARGAALHDVRQPPAGRSRQIRGEAHLCRRENGVDGGNGITQRNGETENRFLRFSVSLCNPVTSVSPLPLPPSSPSHCSPRLLLHRTSS